jgi:hypothetical protein
MSKKKYNVYAHFHASKFVGEFEASSPAKAIEMAESDHDAQEKMYVSLCHHCADDLEVGDMDNMTAEEQ